jgi:hypothetical protein
VKAVLTLTLVLCGWSAASASEHAVKLEKQGDQVAVTIDGKPFTAYHFAKDLPKPYFSPVQIEDGTIVTRGLDNPKDHPHHKGIWLSVDEANEIKFWAEKGKIENTSVELVSPMGNPARMRVVNRWLGTDGEPIVTETSEISIFANRLLAYDVQMTAGKNLVTFADTKEGMFGIRLADPLRESQGGKVVNADGLETTKQCWGKQSAWVDYHGSIDGKACGVSLFDHPLNFRRSRYHVRDYGLFTISPFGEQSYTNGKRPADHLILLPGSSFRLRYALYVHPGDTTEAAVPEVYQEYLKKS